MAASHRITIENEGQKIAVEDVFNRVGIIVTDRDGVAASVVIDYESARELARVINLISIVAEGKNDNA